MTEPPPAYPVVSAEGVRLKLADGRELIDGMSSLDLSTLLDEITERVDTSGNLYIRFDKQKAFRGVEYINKFDPIRIKFKFRIPHKMDPSEHIRSTIKGRSTA